MDYFAFENGRLHCEGVAVDDLAAEHDTPLYVYSRRTFAEHYRRLDEAFAPLDHLICYSVKCNSNLTILAEMAGLGSGFDIVSGGELARVRMAGGSPDRVVFAGVAKTDAEIESALRARILMFNVESRGEAEAIDGVARKLVAKAWIALRVNPDVDPHTHKHISTGKKETKFGLDPETAFGIVRDLPRMENLHLAGIHMHIGSQITTTEPYQVGLERLVEFAGRCRTEGHDVRWINMGGGFGIYYRQAEALAAADYAAVLLPVLEKTGFSLVMEPGRFIMGNAGILLTRVVYVKRTPQKRFVICDAGMNDLIRPTLYDGYHRIWPTSGESPDQVDGARLSPCDVVGPVCETGDFFAVARPMPEVRRGDLLAVFSAGAYGSIMSSNYNTRPRPAELLVDGESVRLVRRRETIDDLVRHEMP